MAIKNNKIFVAGLQKTTSRLSSEMEGNKYGQLLVIKYVGKRICPKGYKQPLVVAQCDCGNIGIYVSAHLRRGLSMSCGCLQAKQSEERSVVHGEKRGCQPRGSKEYSTWQSIKYRCKVNTQYISLGISVCDRWASSFQNFLSDMGRRPSDEYSLERIDNNKGYEPSNCKWATRIEQSNNTRRNKFIVVNGERLTFAQAKRKYNIGKSKSKTIYRQQNNLNYDSAKR